MPLPVIKFKNSSSEVAMAFSSNAVRRFMHDAFSDEDLESFCFDYFNEVKKDFTTGMTKGEKIQLLVEYCQAHEGVLTLFHRLQECLPDQYQKYFGIQPPPTQFEATFIPSDSPSSAELSIDSLAAMAEQRIANQTENIQYYKKFAFGLIAAGLMVIVGGMLPAILSITLVMRLIIAVGGLFICSLSCLQFQAADQYHYRMEECMIFRKHLEVLKKQPVLDAETRAQVNYWMNQAFEGVMKAKPI